MSVSPVPAQDRTRAQVIMYFLRRGWLSVFHLLPVPIRRVLVHHRWKTIAGVVVLVLLVWGYRVLTTEPTPEILTAAVTRGHLIQTVEAVGEVISERDLRLQFPVSGVVAEILVKEGDTVKAGQRVAALRAKNLSANVQSANASLQAAQADLQELEEGARPEDIVIQEAQLENTRAQWTAAQQNAESARREFDVLLSEAVTDLMGWITSGKNTTTLHLTSARTALSTFDTVMADVDVISAFQRDGSLQDSVLRSKRKQVGELIERSFASAENIRVSDAMRTELEKGLRGQPSDESVFDIIRTMQLGQQGVSDTFQILEELFLALNALQPGGTFTRAESATHQTTLNVQKAVLQGALASLDSATKGFQDAAAGYLTRLSVKQSSITSADGSVLNLEASLRTGEAQLALKKAGARQTAIDSAAARVRQARADVQRAQAAFDDTILKAPVDGFITKVNIKTGELLSTSFQQDAAITMLGESPFRVELFVSEVDIPKVVSGQEASIKLDAFPTRPFPLIVAEIDPAATYIDGVPKYRIKLDFTDTENGFKIGMTGDVDIVTGRREDTLMVPARAVIEDADGNDIVRIYQQGAVIERPVQTGMEGENDIEILSGVSEGEEVIVLMKK